MVCTVYQTLKQVQGDGSVRQSDGSVRQGDGSVRQGDGSVRQGDMQLLLVQGVVPHIAATHACVFAAKREIQAANRNRKSAKRNLQSVNTFSKKILIQRNLQNFVIFFHCRKVSFAFFNVRLRNGLQGIKLKDFYSFYLAVFRNRICYFLIRFFNCKDCL